MILLRVWLVPLAAIRPVDILLIWIELAGVVAVPFLLLLSAGKERSG